LNQLHAKYYKSGLVILAFPTAQFGCQEYAKDDDVKDIVRNTFRAKFQLLGRIDVNGPTAHPVYKWLKQRFGQSEEDRTILWNFNTIFTVDQNGNPTARMDKTWYDHVEEELQALLGKDAPQHGKKIRKAWMCDWGCLCDRPLKDIGPEESDDDSETVEVSSESTGSGKEWNDKAAKVMKKVHNDLEKIHVENRRMSAVTKTDSEIETQAVEVVPPNIEEEKQPIKDQS